jgi:hypothetical protein
MSDNARECGRGLFVNVGGTVPCGLSVLTKSDGTHSIGADSCGFLVLAGLPLTKAQVQVERPQRSEDVRPGGAASNGDIIGEQPPSEITNIVTRG